ncbi:MULTISPECIES: hypothetical protein [Kitasatospora]|uniref:DUF2637 domain-containing protein n=1 Tax=Kitasatospora cathayae TaxID=3004092 RepID=A0ABY7Q5B0_9ACTN|nr:hypothetical protein [Kitasatospora sp. HUAS 3-15]WBP87807.1 hypothetical protein O1G21_19455 [Kitasatospora sp. HUAS 3-15]
MYDRMTELLGAYGGRDYEEPDLEAWAAPGDRAREAARPAADWYDDGFGYGLGTAPGDAQAFSPVVASAGWENGTAFVPPPRAPVEPSRARGTGGPGGPSASRHRRRPPFPRPAWPHLVSSAFGALTALTVTAACALSWVFSYGPLQDLAFSCVPSGLSRVWPVVVYGPWLAGCLSVLRAVQHGRQPFHSWVVVVLFSGLAAGLCVADVPWTLPAVVVSGLPPLTGVISLHQLVRQLTAARGARQRLDRQAGHRARR